MNGPVTARIASSAALRPNTSADWTTITPGRTGTAPDPTTTRGTPASAAVSMSTVASVAVSVSSGPQCAAASAPTSTYFSVSASATSTSRNTTEPGQLSGRHDPTPMTSCPKLTRRAATPRPTGPATPATTTLIGG